MVHFPGRLENNRGLGTKDWVEAQSEVVTFSQNRFELSSCVDVLGFELFAILLGGFETTPKMKRK